MCEGFVTAHIAILMIACGDDVGQVVIESAHAMGCPLPHLSARLVEHVAVEYDILVLFYKVTAYQYCLDVAI